jgi:hypothetical protein
MDGWMDGWMDATVFYDFSATAIFHRKVHTKNSLAHTPNLLSLINSFCRSI